LIEQLLSAGLSAIGAGSSTPILPSTTAMGSSSATPFSGMFQSMVDQTSSLDSKASQAVQGLLSGQGTEIHDVMMATQKADMAFELALQVRNKAVAAYQQMMGMQF
jgi:flagellar hook-basal body complex protein FliE